MDLEALEACRGALGRPTVGGLLPSLLQPLALCDLAGSPSRKDFTDLEGLEAWRALGRPRVAGLAVRLLR